MQNTFHYYYTCFTPEVYCRWSIAFFFYEEIIFFGLLCYLLVFLHFPSLSVDVSSRLLLLLLLLLVSFFVLLHLS